MSNDPGMIQAYKEGKDLYCVIAASMFNNNYEDNLEFYPEFTEVELDGKISIAGTDTEHTEILDEDSSITIPWCYLVPTDSGDKEAFKIIAGDSIISDCGNLIVKEVKTENKQTTISFEI